MKKVLLSALIAAMIVPALPVYAEERINVVVDGKAITFDQPPVIEDSRVLVPLRAIFEALDSNVDYTDETKTVSARKGERVVSLKIGDDSMMVYDGENAEKLKLDVPAKIMNGRTMVPVRAVSEGLDADVKWDGETKTVYVDRKKGQHEFSSVKIDAVLKGDDGTGLVDFYYSYPVIKNPKNDPFIKAINDKYKEEAEAFYESVKTEHLKDAQARHDNNTGYNGYPLMAFSLDYTVTIDRNDLLSITQIYYNDFGGAHPITAKVSRTFDLEARKQIKLSDILAGTERDRVSNAFIAFDKYLKEEFADDPEYAAAVKSEMKNQFDNVSFYLDDYGLVMYYQPYQVGPYALGYPQARIPYKNNDMIFKTDLSGAELERIDLVLDGNPTTGFEWCVTESSDNLNIDVEYAYKSQLEEVVGVGGRYKFAVTGTGKGNAYAVFQYKRAWEEDALETIKYYLYVNADNTITIIDIEE